MSEQPLHDLIDRLQLDEFITIKVGPPHGENITVKIQQSLLEAVSEWFSRALYEERWLEGQTSTASFPQDDPSIWSIFIHWIFHRTLPPSLQNWRTIACCWILGDKYLIPSFQDYCMARILLLLKTRDGSAPIAEDLPATKTLILNIPPHCILMRLLGEEVALAVFEGHLAMHDLTCFDGTDGFWTRFLKAHSKIEGTDERGVTRVQLVGYHSVAARLREYMVAR
ncbi:uncharacterized protein RHO25_007712 [Cercospora beticola]|uniref:BTB domain-containing protein n=2 Tax=Cercospora beticola TaxID=122368 RepID=A0ABZ0NUJ6_CERBT|nr:hypothetical protein RHO25_007712 [Cercospora beticola]CAK1358220.1 unnamed protein product [Cercospora beticola]